MIKKLLSAICLSLLPILVFADPKDSDDIDPNESGVRKIVVFQTGTPEDAKKSAIEGVGGAAGKGLGRINAMAARLNDNAVNALRSHPNVLRVDNDLIVEAAVVKDKDKEEADIKAKGAPVPTQPPQSTPWGIARVKAPEANTVTQGSGVKVCVIDTGIDLDHPDLQANVVGGYNAISPTKTANDDNGHGTHVAGTIAALNNAIGVVGVGPQISLLAVKVLSRSGSGWLSDIIEGLDWCANNGGKVANMSLGSSSDNQSFHDAVTTTVNAGVTIVAAAGNSGPCSNCVGYPAKYPEVIAVAASNSSDQLASFSSQGPEVDLIAPGQSVPSTYKGDGYATLSGTSMATPHVTGCAALKTAQNPTLLPSGILDSLKTTADLLGGLSADQQGSGMVNCWDAVTAP